MDSITKRLWLSRSILEWEPDYHSGTIQDSERVQRPHELLCHAHSLIQPGASPFSLSDAVSNLKRAVDSRLQHLEEIYAFSHRFPKKGHGALERLESVGLARPFLIKKLFALRNGVEHHDAQPPNLEHCSELADVVWYFLRTTDYACKTVPQGVVLTCVDGSPLRDPSLCVTVRFSKNDTAIAEISGWLSLSELSQGEKTGFLPIDASALKIKEDFCSAPNDERRTFSHINSTRREDERWVIASFVTPPDFHHSLWRLALGTL